ncbi:hypothetical protein ILUMI_11484 [Ignelater luminosus]|uniref:Uncharacterized protein n=1 Tax=Ignelater luminosus TaxID=2038154 RepID=A0A8K0GDW6_IGNLU|nr:hypothetical protein ILUMI_11484 [Ignelater luminosus]
MSNFTQTKKIGQMKLFGDQPGTVVLHERLNYTKGITSHKDFLNCSTGKIVEALSEEGVVEAKRMTTKWNENVHVNCDKPPHENSECIDPFVCVNCEGSCLSLSLQCPVYKLEKDIKTVQTLKKISNAEARSSQRKVSPTPKLLQSLLVKRQI